MQICSASTREEREWEQNSMQYAWIADDGDALAVLRAGMAYKHGVAHCERKRQRDRSCFETMTFNNAFGTATKEFTSSLWQPLPDKELADWSLTWTWISNIIDPQWAAMIGCTRWVFIGIPSSKEVWHHSAVLSKLGKASSFTTSASMVVERKNLA